MEVLLYFIILKAIPICLSYDLEIEGVMRLGDEFLKKLNDDLYESRKVQTTSRPEIVRPIRPSEFYGGYHDNETRKTGHMGNDAILRKYIKKTVNRIKYYVPQRLVTLQTVIYVDLLLKIDMSQEIGNASKAFSDTFDQYVNNIIVNVGGTELDKQFLLLDLIETSNKYSYSAQKRIFNKIVDENRYKLSKKDIIAATEKMFKQNLYDKKKQIEFLCMDYAICLCFPGFTDYFADLISELLRLSDRKFYKALQMIRRAYNIDAEFIKVLVNEGSLEKIKFHFGKLGTDTGILKDIFSILRAVIVQRHKITHNTDDEMRNKTAAVKILFDIIDKAFENDGEDVIAMNIEIIVQAFRHWKSRSTDISDLLVGFFKYVFNNLKLHLGSNTRKEVKVLTEVIFKGTTNITPLYKYLLTKGSKYVRGEDLDIFRNLF